MAVLTRGLSSLQVERGRETIPSEDGPTVPAARSAGAASRARLLGVLILVQVVTGCAGGSSYVRPNVDFSHIQRCAIIPFQNMTSDGFADERVQSIFLMEVLRRGSLEILEPEETISAMRELRLTLGTIPSPEQIAALGKSLSVEAVFLGSVEDYGTSSRARQATNHLTASFSMAETETGSLIWRSQVHVGGSSIWKRLFGGEPASLYDVSREGVRKALDTLY